MSHQSLALYVKNVLVFEETEAQQKTILPFFADGYPGLIYYQADKGLLVRPHQKRMPEFFLYGQTIKPVELVLHGRYKLVIMQLYPFVIKSFFRLDPGKLNDDCFDLSAMKNDQVQSTIHNLSKQTETSVMVQIISDFLSAIFQERRDTLDYKIREAIQIILERKGQVTIESVTRMLKINPRTFERRFLKETGISAKQFALITQFHNSLQQLTAKEFQRLTELVYANGFADQSHFNRVFKKFTGSTPKSFQLHFD